MRTKNASFAEIAKLANVSKATVSRVLNNPDIVSSEKVTAVHNALKALSIDIPQKKKAEQNPTIVVGMSLATLINDFHGDLLKGIRSAAASHQLQVLIYPDQITPSSFSQFKSFIQHNKPTGIILLDSIELSLLNELSTITSLVQLCSNTPEAKVPYIGIDNYNAAKIAIEHILSTGHNKIAFINSPSQFSFSGERYRAFCDSLEAHHLSIPTSWHIRPSDISFDTITSVVTQLLSQPYHPNAFLCTTDYVAVIALKVAQILGFRVPSDIVIVGFDNTPMCKVTNPEISSIHLPGFEMGYSAVENLCRRYSETENPGNNIFTFSTELIVRGSSLLVAK